MITLIELFENVKSGYSGIKRKEMAAGLGKLIGTPVGIGAGAAVGSLAGPVGAAIGGGFGGFSGNLIGHNIGYKSVEDPEGKIDEKKALHRVGALANTYDPFLSNITGKGIGLAAASSAAPILAPIGLNIAGLAHLGSNVFSRKTAEKLGYGDVGKFGTILSPTVTGLTTPKKLQEKK